MEPENDGGTSGNWRTRYSHLGADKGTGRLWNKKTSGDYPDYREESWLLDETCCHSASSEKPSANTGAKNPQSGNTDNYKI